MKVLVDTSTLYSAIAFDGRISKLMELLIERHTMVISDYIIMELRMNIEEKVSSDDEQMVLKRMDDLFSYCEIKNREDYIQNMPEALRMVSKKDSPIIACAMLSDIDALLTSDKELWAIDSKYVKVLSPADAMEELLG